MKRYGDSFVHNADKHRAQEWKREHDAGGFRCSHCKQFVIINDVMGTVNRNHCNMCLWSKHVDETTGDRQASCHGGMSPIGLTLKHEGHNKIGEVMLIHLCAACQKISINRIARDDIESEILAVFTRSLNTAHDVRARLKHQTIRLLREADRHEVLKQLFGT